MTKRKCFNCEKSTPNDKREVKLLDNGRLVKTVKVVLCNACLGEMNKGE